MPIPKQDGDQVGARVTFQYKGPTVALNVGVIVETKPNVIYLMERHYAQSTGGAWQPQVVQVSGTYNASFLDHGDLVTCLAVIYPDGVQPQANGDGSLIKQGLGDIYVHQSEGEFSTLSATFT